MAHGLGPVFRAPDKMDCIVRAGLCLLLSVFTVAANSQVTHEAGKSPRGAYCVPDVTMPRSCKGRRSENTPDPASGSIDTDITFILYTPKYEPEPRTVTIGNHESYSNSGYNTNVETKIIVHGYFSSAKNFEHMMNAYLVAEDYNVILMDWAGLAKWCYCEHVIHNIERIGKELAKLLDFLVEKGTKLEHVHIIGHSLGAHIAGVGSINCHYGLVGRISALDPARPGFVEGVNQNRLNSTTAHFVDVIHTSAHTFGIAETLGHIDFYVNGGQAPQPGCTGVMAEVCSHTRAHLLFAESITTDVGYRAVRCLNWTSYMNGSCNAHNSPTAIMGERLQTNSSNGVYYLKTGASCPYYIAGSEGSKIMPNMLIFSLTYMILLLSYVFKKASAQWWKSIPVIQSTNHA